MFCIKLLEICRWTCADKRYLIQKKIGGGTPMDTIAANCTWYTNYTLIPADLQCVLTYCTNATTFPNENNNFDLILNATSSLDINFNTLGKFFDRTPLKASIFYPCKNYILTSNTYRLENLTDFQSQADIGINVTCNTSGVYNYPATWPQCSANITCTDPGITEDLLLSEVPGTPTSLSYLSQQVFTCADKRKWVKIATAISSPLTPNIVSTCLWRKLYNVTAKQLICTLHHCANPYLDDGGFAPPPPENNLILIQDAQINSSLVPFGSYITFNCTSGTFIETNQTDPSQTQVFVQCLSTTATYNIPTITNTYVHNISLVAAKSYVQGAWPNCTSTVLCGQPPLPPTNGSVIWLYGSPEYQVMLLPFCARKYFLFSSLPCLGQHLFRLPSFLCLPLTQYQ